MSFASPLKTLAIAALIGAGLTSAAYAQDQVFTARLAQPVAQHTRIVADNAVWTCEGDTCQAVVHHASTVHDCRMFVREAGTVVEYGPADNRLSADQITRCNGDLPQVQQARN